MTNHFHAIDAAGTVHKRSSASRVYTHTVVAKLGEAYAARELAARLAYRTKEAPRDFAFYQSQADGSWFKQWSHMTAERIAEASAEAAAKIAGHTVETYTAAALEKVRASHAAAVAKGYFTEWHNIGWCGRPDLAGKLAASKGRFGYGEPEAVVILPAIAGKAGK